MRKHTNVIFWSSAVLLLVLCGGCESKTDRENKEKVALFRKECAQISGAWPNFELVCESLATEKKPEQLDPFLQLVRKLSSDLTRLGPVVATQVVASCSMNSTLDKPSASELMFCLSFSGLNVEQLTQGTDEAKKYAEFLERVRIPKPVYPSGSSPDQEAIRDKAREAMVYACIKQGEAYLKAACSAIAVHEIFADRPFGSSGELAKAFDELTKIYAVAGLPQQFAKQALKDIGVPAEILDAPDKINGIAYEAAAEAAESAKRQHEQTKTDVNDFFEANGVDWRL